VGLDCRPIVFEGLDRNSRRAAPSGSEVLTPVAPGSAAASWPPSRTRARPGSGPTPLGSSSAPLGAGPARAARPGAGRGLRRRERPGPTRVPVAAAHAPVPGRTGRLSVIAAPGHRAPPQGAVVGAASGSRDRAVADHLSVTP